MVDSPKLRVLVVDDNVDGADCLGGLLQVWGCDTAVAYDGVQALSIAANFFPQLAFIDLEVPMMSGLEVAEHLRADEVTKAVMLVCQTGRGQPDDRRICMEAGFDDFMTKPLEPSALIAVLTKAWARRCR